MKIKVYIITYKRNDVLNTNLASLWAGCRHPEKIYVKVLANHPDIKIDKKNMRPNLEIVYNTTRMPHAWGYLSRDWNWCILDGFRTWENPDNVDWVVMTQNDVTWVDGWDENLINVKDYDFVTQPVGDQAMAININAVKQVGFFDERFTTLHYQEADYFIRAIKILGMRCSICDDHPVAPGDKNLDFNPMPNLITQRACGGWDHNDENLHNKKNWPASYAFTLEKYGQPIRAGGGIEKLHLNTEINWYPFFWDGYENAEKLFPVHIPDKRKTKWYRFYHLYWLRGKS